MPAFVCPQARPAARLRLLVFPFGGGSPGQFFHWQHGLPADVELCIAQYPGRAGRLNTPPHQRMEPLLDEYLAASRPLLDRPLMLFGHSLGASLAWELACRGADWPIRRLWVSGRPAPHIPLALRHLHLLPRDQLVEELRKLNGTPAEALDHPELLDLVLPALRADFSIVAHWQAPPAGPLDIPITACCGGDDLYALPEQMAAWRACTTRHFELRQFDGDHFFVLQQSAQVLQAIVEQLSA